MSAGAGSLRRGSGPSSSRQGPDRSGSQRSSYEERCVDTAEDRPPTPEPKTTPKARPRDANGKEQETVGLVAAPADPPSAVRTCDPCASPSRCQTLVCGVLTCGLYRVCRRSVLSVCLAPNERPPDEPESVGLRAVNPGGGEEEDAADWLGDVCIAGVRVDREYLDVEAEPPANELPPGAERARPSHAPLQESVRFEGWGEEEEDVDSLITRKLLELYSEYQIEELARCTSDSVFLRKSRAIDQLINSLAEEHQMDEQEAECRLVRGIIRISTRKSARRRAPPHARRERTLSDSGNETMRESSSCSLGNNKDDYKSHPNIQISDLTSTDKYAREMWRNNGGHTSASPATSSPSHTETSSSGISLIHASVRT